MMKEEQAQRHEQLQNMLELAASTPQSEQVWTVKQDENLHHGTLPRTRRRDHGIRSGCKRRPCPL